MRLWLAMFTNGYGQVNISWVQEMQEVINGRLLPNCSNGILCLSSEMTAKMCIQISGSLNWLNRVFLGFKNWMWNSDEILSRVSFKMLADVVLGFQFIMRIFSY